MILRNSYNRYILQKRGTVQLIQNNQRGFSSCSSSHSSVLNHKLLLTILKPRQHPSIMKGVMNSSLSLTMVWDWIISIFCTCVKPRGSLCTKEKKSRNNYIKGKKTKVSRSCGSRALHPLIGNKGYGSLSLLHDLRPKKGHIKCSLLGLGKITISRQSFKI